MMLRFLAITMFTLPVMGASACSEDESTANGEQASQSAGASQGAQHQHKAGAQHEQADQATGKQAEAKKKPSKSGDIPAPDNVAKPPEDAKKTDSGLATKVLEEGDGKKHPKPDSVVRVHYTGWTTDGKMFDSSVKRGEPTEFPLNAVIKGWQEGLQLMVPGEKRRLWIPEKLAYKGAPGKPQGMLVFDVELLEIVR